MTVAIFVYYNQVRNILSLCASHLSGDSIFFHFAYLSMVVVILLYHNYYSFKIKLDIAYIKSYQIILLQEYFGYRAFCIFCMHFRIALPSFSWFTFAKTFLGV